jgi:hypothetical protein
VAIPVKWIARSRDMEGRLSPVPARPRAPFHDGHLPFFDGYTSGGAGHFKFHLGEANLLGLGDYLLGVEHVGPPIKEPGRRYFHGGTYDGGRARDDRPWVERHSRFWR